MTAFVQEELEGLIATSDLRRELLGVLSDGDLAFRPHEGCLTLGELCREMGELEHTYYRVVSHLSPGLQLPP